MDVFKQTITICHNFHDFKLKRLPKIDKPEFFAYSKVVK